MVRVYCYVTVVSLQYLTPLILTLNCTLLLKTLGEMLPCGGGGGAGLEDKTEWSWSLGEARRSGGGVGGRGRRRGLGRGWGLW